MKKLLLSLFLLVTMLASVVSIKADEAENNWKPELTHNRRQSKVNSIHLEIGDLEEQKITSITLLKKNVVENNFQEKEIEYNNKITDVCLQYDDTDVKAGQEYTYRVKVVKSDKSIVYSDDVTIGVGKAKASLKVKSKMKPSTTKKTKKSFVIRVASGSNKNGVIRIYKNNKANKKIRECVTNFKNGKQKRYKYTVTKYSYNKKKWSKIPKNGILVTKKSVYIKGYISRGKKKNIIIKDSLLLNMFDYHNSFGNNSDSDENCIYLNKNKAKVDFCFEYYEDVIG